ncbi:hypothetical protein BASA62_009446 [Batrachochytrium salamandrivorans]|nr:hypothetical protein BASA62_009446 [Batrachochytrium salamandrivorans]
MRPGRKPVGKANEASIGSTSNIYDLSQYRQGTSGADTVHPMNAESISRVLSKKLQLGRTAYLKVGDRVLVAARPICQDSLGSATAVDVASDTLSKDRAAHLRSLGKALLKSPKLQSLPTVTPDPHIFDLAGSALIHLLNDRQDQCIVLSGVSNSGKSESGRLIARHLSDLSRNTSGTKKTKIHSAAIKMDFVLSAFGNAASPQNIHGSHFSRYTEYQFNDDGAMIGVKLLTYNLEKQRITDACDLHANFNVFYYLLAGCGLEMRTKFSLTEASGFHYLNRVQSKPPIVSPQHHFSPDNLNLLSDHLKAVGIPKKTHMDIFQLLAGILHLGNINFVRTSGSANQPCTTKNPQQMEITASLLGLKPEHLLSTLTFETKAIGRELCTTILDIEGAIRQRDTLAQLLYGLLFQWITEHINARYCREESEWTHYISVVDFQGIQTSSPGTGRCLARLVSNYAAERVHDYVVSHLFKATKTLLSENAIRGDARSKSLSLSSLESNSDVLHILSAPTTGIITLIQNESMRLERSMSPSSSESSSALNSSDLVDRIFKSNVNNSKLLTYPSAQKKFGILHYIGAVEYDVFATARYNDISAGTSISTDFISLFCGSMDQPATQFALARQLFSKRAITVDLHPKNRLTLMRARLSIMSTRRPSTLRKRNTLKLGSSKPTGVSAVSQGDPDSSAFIGGNVPFSASVDTSLDAGHTSILNTSRFSFPKNEGYATGISSAEPTDSLLLDQTRLTMDDLLESLTDTNMWFAMHICPQGNVRGINIDSHEMSRQVKALQLDTLTASCGILYVLEIPFEELLLRTESLSVPLLTHAVHKGGPQPHAYTLLEKSIHVLDYIGIPSDLYILGDYKIFFTEAASRMLYSSLNNGLLLRELSAGDSSTPEYVANLAGVSRGRPSAGQNAVSGNPVTADNASDYEDHDHGPSTHLIASDNTRQQRKGGVNFRAASMAASATSLHTAEDDPYEVDSMYDFTFFAEGGPELNGVPQLTIDQPSSLKHVVSPHGTDINLGDYKASSGLPNQGTELDMSRQSPTDASSSPTKPRTRSRRIWMCCTWGMTWWIPTPFISYVFKKRRPDVQIAWREKVALCFIIFLMCATMLFLIVGLGQVVCPKQNILSEGEVSTLNTLANPYVILYGGYYHISDVVKTHVQSSSSFIASAAFVSTTLGRDVSAMFNPTLIPKKYCPNLTLPPGWDNVYQRSNQGTPQTWYSHQNLRNPTATPTDYIGSMAYMKKGQVARSNDWISSYILADSSHRIIVAWGKVYDISAYYDASNVGALADGPGFFGPLVKQIFDAFSRPANLGHDATSTINQLQQPQYGGPVAFANFRACMDGLFMTGVPDTRSSLRCVLPNYIMLAASIVMVSVIGFKFLGALQLTSKVNPENHLKFVICQVPCYTEDEDSLKKTIDSIACTQYDDRHKLLFIVCDGMIIGAGNDRPTPRIVLDILGVDPDVDPESHSFQSLGVGLREHNMGKIFSGLYDVQGRLVPFIVVVKTGTPLERNRPGNRGKRDSQLVLMRFLNRVHFNAPLAPLEIELMRHMKHIIGVDPALYEYVLMVDADTMVFPDSLNLLISSMIVDGKIVGICGETRLSNEQASWVTMIQVYEYYISHHLSKAFESLFWNSGVSSRLLLSVQDQIQQHQPTGAASSLAAALKTKFVAGALCQTGAPETWSVFLSQRRRWINSTVHNLFELVFLTEMCGFCCFSMRFVIFIDLFATFLQPSALIYIVYLIYSAATQSGGTFPVISLIMLAAIYGLQMIIFVIKGEWQHVGWMVIYMLAMPVFGFYVPLYSFWHFDDFSWGNTRLVVGDNGKGTANTGDHGQKMDPSLIPLRRWDEIDDRSGSSKKNRLNMEHTDSDESYVDSNSMPRLPPNIAYLDHPATDIYAQRAAGFGMVPSEVADADQYRQFDPVQKPPNNASRGYGQPNTGMINSRGSSHSRGSDANNTTRGNPAAYFDPTHVSPTTVPHNTYPQQVLSAPFGLTTTGVAASDAFGHDSNPVGGGGGLAIYPPQRILSSLQYSHESDSMSPPMIQKTILDTVKEYMLTADHTTVTKRQVREYTVSRLGLDKDSHRMTIDGAINTVLTMSELPRA